MLGFVDIISVGQKNGKGILLQRYIFADEMTTIKKLFSRPLLQDELVMRVSLC